MSAYFVDTSALAKRYLSESGSEWTITWAEPQAGNVIVVAEITTIEMFSLFATRQREGTLTQAAADALRNDFLLHLEQEYLVLPADVSVIYAACELVIRYPLRTLDAIQLACALDAVEILRSPLIFVSGDNNLLRAASSQGFATDNPNLHP